MNKIYPNPFDDPRTSLAFPLKGKPPHARVSHAGRERGGTVHHRSPDRLLDLGSGLDLRDSRSA